MQSLLDLQIEIRRQATDEELEALVARLVNYPDESLRAAFEAIVRDWDQDDPRHFNFPSYSDFYKRIPTSTTDKPSQYADEKCPRCGGSGWLVLKRENGNPFTRRCECFTNRVKQIEAAKRESQKLLPASQEQQQFPTMVTSLVKRMRM